MKDVITISTVSFTPKWGEKAVNLNRILGYIECAARRGSDLIAFPEMALTGYDDEGDKDKKDKMQMKEAETVPGPSSEAVARLTKKYGIYAVYGFPERDPDDPEKLYNSACVCGPDGIIGVYRKIHLAAPEFNWAVRGDRPMLVETPWGPIGIGICYDTYSFPELTRYYAAKGARIYINSTAHAKCHRFPLSQRAMESNSGTNNMFIVTSNLVGKDLYNDFIGSSSIIGPAPDPVWFQYYAGYPFTDSRGYERRMYTETVDLTICTRNIYAPNPGLEGSADYRPQLYKEWMEDLLKDEKYRK